MKAWIALVIALIAAVAGVGGGYWFGHRAGDKGAETPAEAKPDEKPNPVATVRVAPLRRATIAEEITAYGTVIAPASDVQVVSAPFECRVARVLVTPGQTVTKDESLVEVDASAATTLAFEEARNAAASAERDLQAVKLRFEQKLATNADLNAADSAMRTAQSRLQNLQQAGAGSARTLKAPAAGSVNKIDVQVGKIVPTGGPLVEVAPQDRTEIRVGVDPLDAAYLKQDQPVKLHRVDQSGVEPTMGTIRMIDLRVDPATRLVNVYVKIPQEAKFLVEGFVAARMSTRSATDVLVAPRDAVLPGDGDEFEVFTIKDGKAVKRIVHVGIENDRDVQITSDDLKEGDPVVIVGNAELEEGMKVEVAQPATLPTSGQSGGSLNRHETIDADFRSHPSNPPPPSFSNYAGGLP